MHQVFGFRRFSEAFSLNSEALSWEETAPKLVYCFAVVDMAVVGEPASGFPRNLASRFSALHAVLGSQEHGVKRKCA